MVFRCLIVCSLSMMTGVLNAQEGRVIIRSSVNGTDVPPEAVQSFVAPILSSADVSFFPHSMVPDDPLGMLQRKQIQDELDLSKDQVTLVEELQKDIQRQMGEVFATQAKFGGDAARMMESATKAIRKNIEKELNDVLSFKQMKRLGQLEVQMKLRNRGVRALAEEKLANALEISDDQKKEIRKQARDMHKDLQKEIERLRERFRERLIKDLLEEDQLAKLEEISGEEYEVQQTNIRRWTP